jgi:hypothetical protein
VLLTCFRSMVSEWHSCLRVFLHISSCSELFGLKRLANLDLLPARIPQIGGEVNVAFNKLKKTREMFWSGRRDLNSGPPAPKARAISLGSPSFSITFLKTKGLSQDLVVAPCIEMWLHMHRVPPISPSAKKQRSIFSDSVSIVWRALSQKCHSNKGWSR